MKFLVTFLVTTRTLLVPMRGCIQCKSRSRPNTSERLAPALWSRARRKKKGKRRNGGAHTETGGEGRPRGVRRPLNRPRVATSSEGWRRYPWRRVGVAAAVSAFSGPIIDSEGVGPAAMTRGCICRESVRWRGVCGPPSLECSRRGSCRRCPAPRVHPRRWGRSTTVRWSAPDAERPRGSVAARGQARARVRVESRGAEAVRKVHFERLVRRLGWTEDLPAEASPRGAERCLQGEARAGRRGDRRRFDVGRNGIERRRIRRSETSIYPRECRPPFWLRGGYSLVEASGRPCDSSKTTSDFRSNLSPFSFSLFLSLSIFLYLFFSLSLFLPLPLHFAIATISFPVTKWSEWFPEENRCRLCRSQPKQAAFRRFGKPWDVLGRRDVPDALGLEPFLCAACREERLSRWKLGYRVASARISPLLVARRPVDSRAKAEERSLPLARKAFVRDMVTWWRNFVCGAGKAWIWISRGTEKEREWEKERERKRGKVVRRVINIWRGGSRREEAWI